MIVQQGYKLSIMILYGNSRLDRQILFGLCTITHPPTLIVRKMVAYVDLKNTCI